tara:strand:- start:127 stop:1164 length:1038 start_codon:yes stop_codon:yes gene_type:complete
MFDFEDFLISPDKTIFLVIEKINRNKKQFVFVTDENRKLLGVITDGDLRRGMINGYKVEDQLSKIMNNNPFKASINDNKTEIIRKMREKKIKQCPILDSDNSIISIQFEDSSNLIINQENLVVIMSGGRGSRLMPLTKDKPKPLIEINGKPILETIINKLVKFGYRKIILSVNYKSRLLEDYFGDGSKFGVQIDYIKEEKPLGTAGSLSLIKRNIDKPFIVMNSDLVTDLNYFDLLEYHKKTNSKATMCIKNIKFELPYGVIKTKDSKLIDIQEKPFHEHSINAGIYVLNPEILNFIPKDIFFDMTDLFNSLIDQKLEISTFPIFENWHDIGSIKDLEKINKDEY